MNETDLGSETIFLGSDSILHPCTGLEEARWEIKVLKDAFLHFTEDWQTRTFPPGITIL